MSDKRSPEGHLKIEILALQDRLRDRWLATDGLDPTCTVADILEDFAALGCERAGAMLERERRRPALPARGHHAVRRVRS